MSGRRRLLRLLDRLTFFLPGGPPVGPDATVVPDPQDPRASLEARRARRLLWSHSYRKRGKGGFR